MHPNFDTTKMDEKNIQKLLFSLLVILVYRRNREMKGEGAHYNENPNRKFSTGFSQ